MNDEQFTALAREFAKAVNCAHLHILEDKGEPLYDIPEDYLEWYEDCLTSFLQWISCYYCICIVEKSVVNKLWKEHLKENRGTDKGSREWFFYNGRLDLLKSLFPEIAKEVES